MIKILELFGGIGACSKALERLGIDYEIADYVEIDKYAVKSFNAIHGTNFEPQDICEWNKDINVDLIMHGSPCQDFSLAGLQAGGDEGSGTRSSLMYETIRIVEKLKPKYVIWENVKNVISKKHKHNYDNYCNKMSELGYKNYGQVLNAKDYGIPQNRERVFTISIRNDVNKEFVFPDKQELKLKLKDMLEDNVDEKYYLSDKMINYISSRGTANFKNPDSDDLPNNYDLIQIGQLYGTEKEPNPQDGRIYDADGLIPTLDTQHIPKMAIKNAYLRNFGSKGKLQDKEYCDTLTASMGTGGGNVPILKEEKDIAIKTIGNYSPSNHNASRIVDSSGIAPTVMENHGTITATNVNNLRIRKLTPKECWRLMGFDDKDYEKAAQVNSNTQLYKQAGNSIVVNVLEAILGNLLDEKEEV